jgi:hypothetical protein
MRWRRAAAAAGASPQILTCMSSICFIFDCRNVVQSYGPSSLTLNLFLASSTWPILSILISWRMRRCLCKRSRRRCRLHPSCEATCLLASRICGIRLSRQRACMQCPGCYSTNNSKRYNHHFIDHESSKAERVCTGLLLCSILTAWSMLPSPALLYG